MTKNGLDLDYLHITGISLLFLLLILSTTAYAEENNSSPNGKDLQMMVIESILTKALQDAGANASHSEEILAAVHAYANDNSTKYTENSPEIIEAKMLLAEAVIPKLFDFVGGNETVGRAIMKYAISEGSI